jgi:hypothetical protein
MSIRNALSIRFASSIIVLIVLVIASIFGPSRVGASSYAGISQPATTCTVDRRSVDDLVGWNFGPVGIANEQSVHATLTNLLPTGPDERDPVVISAQLTLFDEHGTVVAQTEELPIVHRAFRSFTIARSGISQLGDRETGRLEVFAKLKVFASNFGDGGVQSINDRAAEFLPATFEVINSDAATSVARIGDGTSNTVAVVERRPSAPDDGDNDDLEVFALFMRSTLGVVRDQAFLVSVRNPDEIREPIVFQVKVLNKNGAVIALSPEVEIPPGESHTVRFRYDDLIGAVEPDTGRAQVRTVALWGLRTRSGPFSPPRDLPLFISFEVMNNASGRTVVLADGSVKFVSPNINR